MSRGEVVCVEAKSSTIAASERGNSMIWRLDVLAEEPQESVG
jgi:hypothetical protein